MGPDVRPDHAAAPRLRGQGRNSSARLERYLQMCAQHNMQVCVPSTPAQVFHMLRRQVVRPMRRPLIVMTPKSLLRRPLAVSKLEELAEGTFQNAIGEIDALDPKGVKRVVFCSGKVYYDDLLDARRKGGAAGRGPGTDRAALPLPGRGSAPILADCPRHRLRLVSGRAAEPGRLVQHPSPLRQRAAKPCPSALCRSSGLGLTGRRLHVRPRQAAKALVEDAPLE